MIKTQFDDTYDDIRDAVHAVCAQFSDESHGKVDDQRAYHEAFVEALTKAGWPAALIPQEYGGSGLRLTEASVIVEEINRSGRQLRGMPWPDVQHGHAASLRLRGTQGTHLPKIASGEWRLQSMGATEPSTGTDTTKIKTTAVKKRDRTS